MMKLTQRQAVLAAIARREWLLQMLALGAAGCRRGGDRAYSRGSTLIVAVDNERPLRPDWPGESLVFLPLVRTNEKGDRQACLATDWEHSADYREWTYLLRPNVRWHDGRPVTVDDVKFTIDLHARPDDRTYKVNGTDGTSGCGSATGRIGTCRAAAPYLDEFRRMALDRLPLERAHEQACRLAEALLPQRPAEE